VIETDYLVVGAGAAGMGFVDALVAASDADVVLVDRRHRPGGHWNDDYAFVRLHQPSAYYGVNSRPLGADRIDAAGVNAGFYERASAAEICDYYGRLLDEDLLPSGRVRFFGMHDASGFRDDPHGGPGEHELISRITGATTRVRVRRAVVDATYIQTSTPSQHKPAFSIEPGARLIPPNRLVDLPEPASGITVLGAGKTSMDTICWLVEQGVDPDRIRWVRPRDPYTIDRRWMQPLSLVGSMSEWLARQYEAAVVATDPADLLRRLEEREVLTRLDPATQPSVFRGVTLSAGELATLRSVRDVVRLGRVTHLGLDRIDLQEGSIPTDSAHVHVDCTAAGLGHAPLRPIFEPGRVTIQRVQSGIDPFIAAVLGHIEAVRDDVDEKNRLCTPLALTGDASRFAEELLITLENRARWVLEPDIAGWLGATRLSPFRGASAHLTDEVRASIGRMFAATGPAIANLQRIVADRSSG
jgi:hypothetical protein